MFALFASKDKKSTFLKNKPMGDDKDKYFTYFFVVPIGLSFKNIDFLAFEAKIANKTALP